nr:dTDP-glucose 4,6-dehydratase [Saccharospirillum mangrovi]
MNILVTGGVGFIGSAFIRHLLATTPHRILNVDKLTYAANPATLADYQSNNAYRFVRGDIGDAALMRSLLADFQPDAVVHLAAESHVDRAIAQPADFMQTNVVGTYILLECCRDYWDALPPAAQSRFRFLHVSTDEVYGDLPRPGEAGYDPSHRFSERSAHAPNNPYAASKAASDHLVRAWHRTYGLPVLISHCSNNYGPFQFPEKLIPLAIGRALQQRPIPVYGNGEQIRDWLYVDDHARALYRVLTQGRVGESYNLGGDNEVTNLALVRRLCALLDQLKPAAQAYAQLIEFVADRPGHDRRYAIDHTKASTELGWQPETDFDAGLNATVAWYVSHPDWFDPRV